MAAKSGGPPAKKVGKTARGNPRKMAVKANTNAVSARAEIASGGRLAPIPAYPKHYGELDLGGVIVDCYVLEGGERVLSQRGIMRSISGDASGNLGEYLGVSALRSHIDRDKILASATETPLPGSSLSAKMLRAEDFLDICRAYVEALRDGDLTTDRQRQIAIQCSIILSACAKVGLIALIDEATGYQYERAEDALQLKLRAFVAEELREWEKTFPDDLWEQFGRLTHWQGQLHQRPKWWGKLVIELIYNALDPDIAQHLKTTKPSPRKGRNYHQWMTEDLGLRALLTHIWEIIGIAKTCGSIYELKEKVALHYGKEPVQITMYLPKNVTPANGAKRRGKRPTLPAQPLPLDPPTR
jgi:P63C domain